MSKFIDYPYKTVTFNFDFNDPYIDEIKEFKAEVKNRFKQYYFKLSDNSYGSGSALFDWNHELFFTSDMEKELCILRLKYPAAFEDVTYKECNSYTDQSNPYKFRRDRGDRYHESGADLKSFFDWYTRTNLENGTIIINSNNE